MKLMRQGSRVIPLTHHELFKELCDGKGSVSWHEFKTHYDKVILANVGTLQMIGNDRFKGSK